jgi:hypothetical protein
VVRDAELPTDANSLRQRRTVDLFEIKLADPLPISNLFTVPMHVVVSCAVDARHVIAARGLTCSIPVRDAALIRVSRMRGAHR